MVNMEKINKAIGFDGSFGINEDALNRELGLVPTKEVEQYEDDSLEEEY